MTRIARVSDVCFIPQLVFNADIILKHFVCKVQVPSRLPSLNLKDILIWNAEELSIE